jgi:hypothetical protein
LYKEEYDGLCTNDIFDIISEDEYLQVFKLHNVKAMPSMCTFTVEKTNGVHTRAKSCIVGLGISTLDLGQNLIVSPL